tara:strand:+ start:3177 stop:3518 length:342 start_codon:yes stop_codon:yes gene_type:complete
VFKSKFIVSVSIFVSLLIITSALKNKTRILEKQITNLNIKIFSKKKDINESQLDFHYLTSPAQLEKKISIIGLNNYQPIIHSKIFSDISDLKKFQNKVSILKNNNEKKIKKKY